MKINASFIQWGPLLCRAGSESKLPRSHWKLLKIFWTCPGKGTFFDYRYITHLLHRTNGSFSRAEFARSFLFFSFIYPSNVIDVDLLGWPLLESRTANPTINLLDSSPVLPLYTSPLPYTPRHLLMLGHLPELYTMICRMPKCFLLPHICTPKLFSRYDFKTFY